MRASENSRMPLLLNDNLNYKYLYSVVEAGWSPTLPFIKGLGVVKIIII